MVWQQWQHLMAFYQSPTHHWQQHNENRPHIIRIFLLSLLTLPALLLFFSTTLLGWQIGDSPRHFLTFASAGKMAIAMTTILYLGAVGFAWIIHQISSLFGEKTDYSKCLSLVIYTGSPLLLSSISVLSTHIWIVMCFGLIGIAYSIQLLHKGIPIVMRIPEDQAFIYSTLLITCGSVILVTILTVTVLLWDSGLSPHLVLL